MIIVQNNIYNWDARLDLRIKKRVLEFLAQNPDSQGLDIRDALAPEIPMSTFYDTLRRMRITYKKRA